MTPDILNYLIGGLIAALCLFAFAIGVDKMIKIIVHNYLLSAICLATSLSLDIMSYYWSLHLKQIVGFWISREQLIYIIKQGKITFVLALYVIMMIILFAKSKLSITMPTNQHAAVLIKILLIPLTVISALITLSVAILGSTITHIPELRKIAEMFVQNPLLYFFIGLLPVRILIHGVVTIILTADLKIQYSEPSPWPSL